MLGYDDELRDLTHRGAAMAVGAHAGDIPAEPANPHPAGARIDFHIV